MSTERWDDERLDRLASLTENNARAIEDHNRLFEKHDRLIESNARVIQSLANVAAEANEERSQLFQSMTHFQEIIAQHQERMTHLQEIIVQQQSEIRGMQLENRRILDILLNQRDQGDHPTT